MKTSKKESDSTKVGLAQWYYHFNRREIEWSSELFQLMQRDPGLGPLLLSEPNPYLDDEQRVLLVEWVRQCVRNIDQCTGYLEGLDGKGRKLFMRITMSPLQAQDGQVEAISGTLEEIPQESYQASELPGNSSWYLHLINHIEEVVFSLDAKGNGLFVNTAWERLTGFTMPDFILIPFVHFVDPEFREAARDAIHRLATCSTEPVNLQLKLITAESEGVWVELHARCTPEPTAIGQITGTLINIHQKKESERILHNQRIAISSAVEGIAVLNDEGNYVYLNQAHLALFGFKEEKELLGKSWKILYDDDEQQRIAEEFMPIMREKGVVRFEARGRCPDGTTLFQDICLTSLPEGGLICITHDVTEKHKQAEQLEEMALVANLSNLGVGIINLNSNVQWLNDALLSRIQWESHKMELLQVVNLFGEVDPEPGNIQRVNNAIKHAKACRLEFFRRSKQGDISWFLADLVPVADKHGKPVKLIWVENDISEQKLAASETRLALERERELNTLKTQFIQLASHEFRTPMASIQTSIDVLKHHAAKVLNPESELRKTIERHHDRILIEIQRMTGILSDVLLTGKLESGKANFNPMLTNPLELIRSIWDEEQLSYIGRRVNLKSEGAVRLALLDRTLMSHLLKNLLNNAFKYGKPDEVPEVAVVFEPNNVVIRVSDKGIGIPEHEQKNLFQSFFRASNTESIPGTGLGLTLVKKITELHGGKIQVMSKSGKGTTFEICFPDKKLTRSKP
jgi:PAS domain S-box-containing protein